MSAREGHQADSDHWTPWDTKESGKNIRVVLLCGLEVMNQEESSAYGKVLGTETRTGSGSVSGDECAPRKSNAPFWGETASNSKGSENAMQSAGALCCYAGHTVVMGNFRALNYSFVNVDKQ